MSVFLTHHCSSDKIEKNGMGGAGWASSTHGGEERLVKGFSGESGGKETTWETQAWTGG